MLNRLSQSHSNMPGLLMTLLLILAGVLLADIARAADPSKGQKLFSAHCRTCHGVSGRPAMPGVPDFSRGEGLLKPDMELMAVIKSGSGMMPAYRGLLSDEDILDIIAHLRTLRR